MTKPTCEQLFDWEDDEPQLFERVSRTSDAGWRHGCYIFEVFKRLSDGTFWQASYQWSADGETNGLREGTAKIFEVQPEERRVIVYVPKNSSVVGCGCEHPEASDE